MAISASSYGSTDEVLTYVRHLMGSNEVTFAAATRPKLEEVERFIDRRSARLNAILAGAGYTVPIATPQTAVDILAEIVVKGAVADCELTLRQSGVRPEGENDREYEFERAYAEGLTFVASADFAALGSPQNAPSSAIAGISVGGTTRTGQRLKPIFGRTTFGNDPTRESGNKEPGYTEE